MRTLAAAIILGLALTSCEKASTTLPSITSKLISKGSLYGAGQEGITRQNMVIKDASTWNALIAKMNSVNDVSKDFTEVNIDFTNYQIIAVFDDVKSSGGHALDLDVTADSKRILVTVIPSSPQGNAIAVITQPYHIIKIPVSILPVEFK